ncbi:MAG: hypothetical protein ACK4YV_00940 [Emticicia sp.]
MSTSDDKLKIISWIINLQDEATLKALVQIKEKQEIKVAKITDSNDENESTLSKELRERLIRRQKIIIPN